MVRDSSVPPCGEVSDVSAVSAARLRQLVEGDPVYVAAQVVDVVLPPDFAVSHHVHAALALDLCDVLRRLHKLSLQLVLGGNHF